MVSVVMLLIVVSMFVIVVGIVNDTAGAACISVLMSTILVSIVIITVGRPS